MSSSRDTFSPHSHIPYGADGSGFYSDNTIGCYNVILESVPLVLESVKSASVKPGSVFTIADYGCADGGTSMSLLYACVKELRKSYGDDLPIHVIYEDQPVNDFKSLYFRLEGLIPGPESYVLDFPQRVRHNMRHKLLQSVSASSVCKLGIFLHCPTLAA
ncbi:hypothetical protein OS493_017581 [Desmophyllum pertusum]|uniref:Uncharacterized protein n=1 Tax=Desmophyllum pertusum TaxID=174260 RepID=A0A9W9ZNZ4_9CNID|nr:hypothetical protein OS493_017581 [Desmophyllum pertusum]